MPVISFGGLASGLDTEQIVSQMVAIRRRPILALESQKTDVQRGIAILDDIRANLVKLQEAADKLNTSQEFVAKAASSDDESIAGVTAGSASPLGNFAIVVDSLAQTHRMASGVYAETTESVGTGTFSITVDGTTTDVTLAAGADSLADLKTAINDSDAGVTASIMNDGTGYRLLLSADSSGANGSFTVDGSGLSGGSAPTFTVQSTGADASFSIDGISITSPDNTVTDALEGVTLELEKVGSTSVTIEADDTALAENLQEMVDAYNAVVDAINAQSQEGSPLNGNSLLRTVQSRLGTIFATGMDTGGDFRTAGEAGISLDRDGHLSLDQAKLKDALDQDYDSVVNLFVEGSSTNGVAANLVQTIDDLTDFADGLFRSSKDAMNDRIERITDEIETKERSVEIYADTLNRKFTAMEVAIAQLQAQGSGLFGGGF